MKNLQNHITTESNSKVVKAAVALLKKRKEEEEKPELEFSSKVQRAVSAFLRFIQSEDGQCAIELLYLTQKAVVIALETQIHTLSLGNRVHWLRCMRLQFDGFGEVTSDSENRSILDNPSYGPGCNAHNLFNEEAIEHNIREFCSINQKQPEDFLPFLHEEILLIATEVEERK